LLAELDGVLMPVEAAGQVPLPGTHNPPPVLVPPLAIVPGAAEVPWSVEYNVTTFALADVAARINAIPAVSVRVMPKFTILDPDRLPNDYSATPYALTNGNLFEKAIIFVRMSHFI
jgi:hypothetical protein